MILKGQKIFLYSFLLLWISCNCVALNLQQKVPLKVFYRAFCPACKWFIGDPLLELIRSEQFREIVDLRLYPAAGMSESNSDLNCEKGPRECEGHRWQACIIEKDSDNVLKFLGNIACMEGDESGRVGDWGTKLGNCLTTEEREEVTRCYETKSDDLLRAMIRNENAGSVDWMPYTVVREKVLGSATAGVSLTELQVEVCTAYKGPKQFYPDVCKEIVGEQKEYEPDIAQEEDHPAPPVVNEESKVPKPQEDEKVKEETSKTDKVRLEFFWRAFCPGCISFITKPLLKLLREEEFRDIIDFVPVPAAGTFYDKDGNFICVKGLMECMRHKWLSCAIDLFPDVKNQIEHLACLENKDDKATNWELISTKCFKGAQQEQMSTCIEKRSSDLLKAHVKKKEKVKVQWMPYVLLNGAPLGDAKHGITFKQLQEEVCKAYKGSEEYKPTACRSKRLRNEEDEADTTAATAVAAIRPCPPKIKDTKTMEGEEEQFGDGANDKFDDPPTIGRRRDDEKKDAKNEATNENEKAGMRADDMNQTGTIGAQSLILPVICFGIIALIAMRLHRGHKKHA